MTYLYIYRLTSDTGLAPCVDNGLLSLACCKGGQIRNDKAIHAGLRYRMYLPQAAHKLLTAALVALGGAVSRPATDAVKNGSQITGRPFIICFWRKIKKGLDSSVFIFRENH